MIELTIWFLWFLVACTVGVVTTIVSGVTGYKMGKHQSKTERLLEEKTAELRKNEEAVRAQAGELSEFAQTHVEAIIDQSHTQQSLLSEQNEKISLTEQKLASIVQKVPEAVHQLTHSSSEITKESHQIAEDMHQSTHHVLELTEALQITKNTLSQKEKALDLALIKIQELETSLCEKQQSCQVVLTDLESIGKSYIQQSTPIQTLKTQNESMHERIRLLGDKVKKMTEKIQQMVTREEEQLMVINTLSDENKTLKNELKHLIHHISEHVDHTDSTHHLTFFT